MLTFCSRFDRPSASSPARNGSAGCAPSMMPSWRSSSRTFARVHAALGPTQEAWRAQSPLIDDKTQRADPANVEPLVQRVDGEFRHAVDTNRALLERLEQQVKTVISPASQPDQWNSIRDELDKLKLL